MALYSASMGYLLDSDIDSRLPTVCKPLQHCIQPLAATCDMLVQDAQHGNSLSHNQYEVLIDRHA